MKGTLQVFNYSVHNQIGGVLDVHIDGDIVDSPTQELYKMFWGDETSVSFKSFRDQISNAACQTLNVYVNSTGGHVGDAMAIHDYLEELESKGVVVNRIGRGIIASAATYLVMGNNSSMTANSMMMIHNISMVVAGSIDECENQVKAGRKYNNLIRDFYATKTGKPSETISGWMNKETWFNSNEAKLNGFVQNITGEVNFTNSIKAELWPYQNKDVLSIYNSFTNKNNEDMDIKKVTDAIENGFSKFFGNALPKEFKLPDNAAKDFATEIANALKPDLLTEEKVTAMVNKAVEEATAGDVEELGKTFVNQENFEALKTDLLKSIGNKSTTEAPEGAKVVNSKNRFANKTFFNEAK
jgi:ATP-dependent Clp protease, protease subunit